MKHRHRALARISDMHRDLHRSYLRLARESRHHDAEHARLLLQAARARFYFAQLRAVGE